MSDVHEQIVNAWQWVDASRCMRFCILNPCICGRERTLATLAELKEMSEDHFIILSNEGWVVEHPLSCRLAGTMSSCFATQNMLLFKDDILRDMSAKDILSNHTGYYRPGRYRATQDGNSFNLNRVEDTVQSESDNASK